MSAGDFLIISAFLIAIFWVVGKLFIKAMKFVLIALLGMAVVAALVIGPLFFLYAIGIALYGVYAFFVKSNKKPVDDYERLDESATEES